MNTPTDKIKLGYTFDENRKCFQVFEYETGLILLGFIKYERNARLISSAPELLEALELAISKDMLSGEVADKAREAIAKARG